MTVRNARQPGRLLAKVAALIVDESTLASIVRPAIADLQHEVGQAGTRGRRLLAHCRGVWAFWRLIAVLPVVGLQSPITGDVVGRRRAWVDERVFLLLAVAYLAALWAFFGSITIAAIACGVVLATALRWWHTRHPVNLVDRSSAPMADINFASIPVGGDAGGLICMIGCAAILVQGVPGFGWFLVAALVAGVLLARVLSSLMATRLSASHTARSLLGRL